MPTVGPFHGFYWNLSDTNVPVAAVGRGGYPAWQASVIAPSLFGSLWVWLGSLITRARWWVRLWRDIYRLSINKRLDVRDLVTRLHTPVVPRPGVINRTVNRVVQPTPGVIGQGGAPTLEDERAAVLQYTQAVLESPAYTVAQAAVRNAARTLGFANQGAWKPLSHAMKSNPGRAENVYRHLHAWTMTQETLRHVESTITASQLHFVTELAYQGFSLKGK